MGSISIHAPVKGATSDGLGSSSDFSISIHAPVKGATLYIGAVSDTVYNFNPRPREGSDKTMLSMRFSSAKFQSTPP